MCFLIPMVLIALYGRDLAIYSIYAGFTGLQPPLPKGVRETASAAWQGVNRSFLLVELFIQETFPEHQQRLDSWVTCTEIKKKDTRAFKELKMLLEKEKMGNSNRVVSTSG